MGYSAPKIGLGDFPSADITSRGNSRTFFVTASLDAPLTEELAMQASLRRFEQKAGLPKPSQQHCLRGIERLTANPVIHSA